MANSSYTAFLDLLGTKESANLSSESFREALGKFLETIAYAADVLRPGTKIYTFSDCAFVGFQDLSNFYEYITIVRYELFSSGYFFKCSIVPGPLDPNPWRPNRLAVSDPNKLSDIVFGTTFGASSVEAFVLHEKFKGVGIVADSKINSHHLVSTFYFLAEDASKIGEAKDFKYCRKEIGVLYPTEERVFEDDELTGEQIQAKNYIDIFLMNLYTAKTKKRKYGMYYFSALITMIKSSDFTKIQYTPNGWVEFPLLFDMFIISKRLDRAMEGLIGSEVLYIACLGQIFAQQEVVDDNTSNQVITELLMRPKVVKHLPNVPEIVMGKRQRERLLMSVARGAFTPKPNRRQRNH